MFTVPIVRAGDEIAVKIQRPAARLMTIVGLLLIPISLLGYLFYKSTNHDIAFASKERDGVAMLQAVVPLIATLSRADDEPSSADIQTLERANDSYGQKLGVEALVNKFIDELKNHKGDHKHKVLEQGRALVVQIGDNSNLILDPELDTYYLMEVVVGLMPKLLELSADLAGHSESHEQEIAELDEATHQQLSVGEFAATLTAFKTSIGKALQSSTSGKLAPDLLVEAETYAKDANRFAFAFLPNKNTANSVTRDEVYYALIQKNFTDASLKMWAFSTSNLDVLLQHRIELLRRQQWVAGGTSALVTLIALGLALTLLTRIVGKLDERIVYLAHYDSMTHLKNRSAFTAELEADIGALHRTERKCALHLVDVDHFKKVNDSLGHQVGDAVLVAIANRLTSICGPNEVIGRLGGDEFVVLQKNVTEHWQANAFADRLVTSLRDPLQIENKPFKASVTVGTSLAPAHGDTAAKIMHSADLALYSAKSAGRNQARIYSVEMNNEVMERQRIEGEIRNALEDNRFFLNFQAQFDATGKSLRGFEALLRCRTRNGEVISPLQFIPLVEQMGLIDDVGAWVLEKAALTAAQWPDKVSLAVNISPLQLRSGKLVEAVQKALRISGIEPQRLEIEVTENILMDDTKSVLQQLQEIKALGVSIALDDFGSGYSSLSYLWRFPFDKLKIDRSFMRAYEADREQAENILRTIIILGHSLQMTVTAEGVETSAQAQFLNGVKCDEIQGFIYARPVPEQDLAAVLLKAFEDELEIRKLLSLIAPDNPSAVNNLLKVHGKSV